MRTGVLFRSNRLDVGLEDVEALGDLGVRLIIDLREQWEAEAHPDAEVDGAVWQMRTVPGIPLELMKTLASAEETDAAMREHYRGFVADPPKREGVAAALHAVVDGLSEGVIPQVFHCSAGKDRTGWVAAMIQHAVGVRWEDVVADYMLTNQRTERSRAAAIAAIERRLGPERAEALAPAWLCERDQLEEARSEADRCYGGIDGYLAEGLGVGPREIEVLRERLVLTR